ncbi:DUF4373 domain-containing protein [Bacteroides oleiciplenus]|uniref:Lin1244/Lin1753-like N-terminal domain-containing protein n=1 Tax=Bacteroides oleiciplenus YIT 12058 TaxID=742727 RepID=K9EGJ2_9BACE|nr:DUF4373 domain-containing protein [Bacteroides oleiciplenus]EKU90062.1 hypothetical protein HMPREF9447_02572 [Bacteroides oleiciplenus YIT 12058]
MSRIKKRGLDYFPVDIDFMNDRLVRRIMKREGEGALATLMCAFSCIYGGEGYYVHADELFYDDLSASLYNQSAADVKRILGLAIEYGIFHPGIFSQYGVLTSREIQSQYLFSTKRRKSSVIDERFRISNGRKVEEEEVTAEKTEEETKEELEVVMTEYQYITSGKQEIASSGKNEMEKNNVTFKSQNETSGTHSIAQNSIAQNRKEYPLLNSSPGRGTQNADLKSAEEREEEILFSQREVGSEDAVPREMPSKETSCSRPPRKEWTDDDISRLQPPQDGLKRNLDGLVFNLRQHHITQQEQYAIILKSNFGIIGHPLWKGFFDLRESHGKIRFPGKYLLSLCVK